MENPKHARIKEGFREARTLTRQHAKTFYYASLFLPRAKRLAAYAVYAICRISDHSVDNHHSARQLLELEEIKKRIALAYSDSGITDALLLSFRKTIQKYNIPAKYFDELLLGMRMDLDKTHYANFDELYQYCYRVAGVVGLMMLKIFGTESKEAEKYAIKLGIAMQLTNILRDIKEDFSIGRIYLPKEELLRFQISEETFIKDDVTPVFKNCLKFNIERARTFYLESLPGIKMVRGLSARLVICLMKDLYASILSDIEKNDYNVLKHRAHLTLAAKILMTFKILFKGEYL